MKKQAPKTMTPGEREEKLLALSGFIASKRTEAVDARKASGIEAVWTTCEDAYLGMDDANRHEFKDAKWAKSTSLNGNITSEAAYRATGKSTAFVRLTSRYVDAGAAKLCEILLPINDKAFSLSATPLPDMVSSKDDKRPAVGIEPTPTPVAAPAAPMPGMPAPPAAGAPADPAAPQPAPEPAQPTIADLAQIVLDEAEKKAKKAEKRIYDWMIECGYIAENRKVIHDAARLGVGVLKGPFPEMRKSQAMIKEASVASLKTVKRVLPICKWVDPWNCFPDGACGENIHHGDYFLERDFLAERLVKGLKEQKHYLKDQIDKVLKEGPGKCNISDGANPSETEKKKKARYEIWYYYGTISRKDMELLNMEVACDLDQDVEDCYAIITMINDTIVRATLNPLDSGRFPYDAMPWSRRAGSWAGVGIAEQVSMPQRMCNASTRALLNNAGNSAGSQFVIDRDSIEPSVPNDWTITPDKIWFKTPGSVMDDVRKAFMAVQLPNVGDQMMKIVEYSFRLAEESSNIPLISQGQTGPTTPETLGATELQNNNANTLLRSIGYSYDDYITDPKVNAYYEWLLLDPNVPNDEKGDFDINAHGSAAMVERAIQDQTLAMMGQIVINPVFGADPKKWFEEWVKAKRLNPKLITYSEEEQKKLAETPPPEEPAIAVAKINAASREKIAGLTAEGQQPAAAPDAPDTSAVDAAQIRAQTELQKAQIKVEDAKVDREFDAAEAQKQRDHQIAMADREIRIKEIEMQRALQIREMELAHDDKQNLDRSKVDLAKTTITDETKREVVNMEVELAREIKAIDVAAEPPSLIRDDLTTPGTP